jgi:hypothetical protein
MLLEEGWPRGDENHKQGIDDPWVFVQTAFDNWGKQRLSAWVRPP